MGQITELVLNLRSHDVITKPNCMSTLVVAISFSLKECSPDQETERVIFAAGLGFHPRQSNIRKTFAKSHLTHAIIKILTRKSAFVLSHAPLIFFLPG